MEATAKFILDKRSMVDYSPANMEATEGFLQDLKPNATPIGKFLVNHRNVKAQKQALLESAREQEKE